MKALFWSGMSLYFVWYVAGFCPCLVDAGDSDMCRVTVQGGSLGRAERVDPRPLLRGDAARPRLQHWALQAGATAGSWPQTLSQRLPGRHHWRQHWGYNIKEFEFIFYVRVLSNPDCSRKFQNGYVTRLVVFWEEKKWRTTQRLVYVTINLLFSVSFYSR